MLVSTKRFGNSLGWSRPILSPGSPAQAQGGREGWGKGAREGVNFFLGCLSPLVSRAKDPLREEVLWTLGHCPEHMLVGRVSWRDPSGPAQRLAGAQSMFVE